MDNHLGDSLLDQAQARAPSPPPLFGGNSFWIPQCMISDVCSLVKSSFWETKLSPNEFLILMTPPYLGTSLGGGGARGWSGGGQNLVPLAAAVR